MISNKLEKSVRNQLGYNDWNDKELHDTLKDVRNNGADGGFSGFIYYPDTCKFARDNMKEILESIKDMAFGMGEDPLVFIQDFKSLERMSTFEIASIIYNKPDQASINDGTDTLVLNALSWYALDETARQYELEEAEQV